MFSDFFIVVRVLGQIFLKDHCQSQKILVFKFGLYEDVLSDKGFEWVTVLIEVEEKSGTDAFCEAQDGLFKLLVTVYPGNKPILKHGDQDGILDVDVGLGSDQNGGQVPLEEGVEF